MRACMYPVRILGSDHSAYHTASLLLVTMKKISSGELSQSQQVFSQLHRLTIYSMVMLECVLYGTRSTLY